MTKRRTAPTEANGSATTEDVIGSLDPLPADPNIRRVKVGRRTVARLPALAVETLRLRVGQRWTPRLAQRVAMLVAEQAAHRDAMRLLSRSGMSTTRLAERLGSLGHDAGLIRRVTDSLVEQGWLDDAAFADSVASAILRRGPVGPELLTARLRARGVPPAVARTVAARRGTTEPDAAAALAEQLCVRQRGTPAQIARRLGAALARRGFDDGTIESALRRLDLPVEPEE